MLFFRQKLPSDIFSPIFAAKIIVFLPNSECVTLFFFPLYMKRLFILFFAIILGMGVAVAQNDNGVPFNGLVTDLTGKPLKGVMVYLHSEGVYARSDKKGRFGLTDVGVTDTLHLRYRKTEYEVPVKGRRSIVVRLGDQFEPESAEDEDLINWGYGYVKRRESIDTSDGIRGEDLVRLGYSSIAQALQGRVAGLMISTPGEPGGEPTVRIRGTHSILLDSTPLFMVDGVEVESLDVVSIYDVDRIEVLRNAFIYGARGANGAILITTKRAR